MANEDDDRSALAVGIAWAARGTTLALMMVLPALGGYFADQWLHTGFLFLLIGAVLGFVAGMWQLVKLAIPPRRGGGDSQSSNGSEHER